MPKERIDVAFNNKAELMTEGHLEVGNIIVFQKYVAMMVGASVEHGLHCQPFCKPTYEALLEREN